MTFRFSKQLIAILTLSLTAFAGCIEDPSFATSTVQQAHTWECLPDMELADPVITGPTELCGLEHGGGDGGGGGGTAHDPATDPCWCYYTRERCPDLYNQCQLEFDLCLGSCPY
jgi:hypothetical protein